MAEAGRHRRYQPSRVNRASVTVVTGGAGMALPLIGAVAAQAAPAGTSDAGPAHQDAGPARQGAGAAETPRTAPATAKPARATPASPTTVPTHREGYTVARGDSLSQIAVDAHVTGGWPRVYADNRTVVGDDPDLIFPGQKLVLRVPAKGEKQGAAGKATGTASATHAKQHDAGSATGEALAGKHGTARPTGAAGAKKRATNDPATSHTKAEPASHTAARPHPDTEAKPHAHTTHKHTESDGVMAPVKAPIGTPYHAEGSSWESGYHTGVDFLVPTGTAVRAIEKGTVVAAGWGGSYGYQVVIHHPDGRYSQYAHLSALNVKVGQRVVEGQRIARSGATGNATGPHLHFEVRTGPAYGSDIDPLAYLRAHGVSV